MPTETMEEVDLEPREGLFIRDFSDCSSEPIVMGVDSEKGLLVSRNARTGKQTVIPLRDPEMGEDYSSRRVGYDSKSA